MSAALLPLFLKLQDRRVLLVGGGTVALAKARALGGTGAVLDVVAPSIHPGLRPLARSCSERSFTEDDLDGAWLIVSAATREVNARVAALAEQRRQLVIAVDDPDNGSAYCGAVLRRDGVTVAVSTEGRAPALAGLLREGLDALLPKELEQWMATAERVREQTRRRAVPMAQRRPALLQALLRLHAEGPSSRQADGRRPAVSLVGAGPGAPDLMTVRGRERLAEADVVLHDSLTSPELRAFAPGARWLDVGKRAGAHSVGQDAIQRLMIAQARRGARVVRLKCGDPLLFGRGGEEALALAAAGIPCEIVPGVSSALAAPAAAGVPVTHRGSSSAVLVVTGHDEQRFRKLVGVAPDRELTLVVLMGLRRRAAIATALIESGWQPSTPAAIVLGATTPDEHVWLGSLGTLGTAPLPSSTAAGTIVVGAAVSVASTLASSFVPSADCCRASV